MIEFIFKTKKSLKNLDFLEWNDKVQSYFSQSKIEAQYKTNRSIKVLVGDYSIIVASHTNKTLKILGLETEFVSNTKDLITKVSQKNNYDLIITNNVYPKGSGEDVLYILKEKGYNIPIVIATAAINSRNEFLEKGFDGYIEKPLELKKTKQEILKVIKDLKFIKI